MRLLFDIEGNDLLPGLTDIWCGVAIDLDTGKEHLFRPHQISELYALLDAADEIAGHNVLGYDIPAMAKMGFPLDPNKAMDTLLLSKLMYPNLSELDYGDAKSPVPARLMGRHSLEAWGFRLGQKKIDFSDFSRFSEQMLLYCAQDVRVNVALYRKLMAMNPHPAAVKLEHQIRTITLEQTANGFPFDVLAAQKLDSQLSARREELKREVQDTFEPTVIQMKTKTKVVPFNLGSRQQIADRLMKRGWQPEDHTETGIPKIDDAVLAGIKGIPEAALLAEYFLIQKRLGMLSEGKQGWLNKATDGRLHGEVDTLGTGTFRCSHSNPNMAQVPSCGAPYGKEIRSLFIAPAGWELMGCDVGKLELVVLAHYMNDPVFSKTLMEGDVHQLLADVYGTDRRSGKTITYAFLYGAGLEKIGSIVNASGTKGEKVKAGQTIRNNMQKRLPALGKLMTNVKQRAKERGYLVTIDGRTLPVRSEHSALNFLCQSAGAIICKQWVVTFHQMLRDRGYCNGVDYQQVAFVHDEVQVLCREGLGETIGSLCIEAIQKAGEIVKLRLPLSGEFKVGKSWSDTH